MNQQRSAIYSLRRQILGGEDIERKLLDMMSDVTSNVLDQFLPEDSKAGEWNIPGLITSVHRHFGLVLHESDLSGKSAEQITQMVSENVKKIYDQQKHDIGNFFEQMGRMLMLQTIDQRWKEHLERIDHLKEGIHLRAHAQKDPLIEYKKEAFEAFQEMNLWIYEETVEKLLKIRLVDQERARELVMERQELDESGLSYAGADESAGFSGTPPPISQGGGGGLAGLRSPSAGGGQANRPMQQLQYGPGPDDEGPQLNREQRRRMKKDSKKRR
jgi:preprotein translocase subunit SecA